MTTNTRIRMVGAAAVVAAGVTVAATATTAAAPAQVEHWVDEWDEVTELCGLEVHEVGSFQGTVVVQARGRDRVAYFGNRLRGTISITNLANGETYTEHHTLNEKDLRITDNGDGTITVLVLGTGGFHSRDGAGKLLLRNPGQLRTEYVIDLGDPTDPEDDEELSARVVKGSTGVNETQGTDFCEVLVAAIG